MNDANTIGAFLSTGEGPRLLLGRPVELRRGVRRFPALVVGASGAWLAIGHVEHGPRWQTPVSELSAVPPAAAMVVDVVTSNLIRSWDERLASEKRTREWIANREAARAALVSRRDAIDEEISAIDRAIAESRA